jgi:hypothetical protein
MERQFPFTMERKGKLKDLDRSFDVAFWQRLGPEAIFDEAWRMALHAHGISEGDRDQFRLQRTVESLQRARR